MGVAVLCGGWMGSLQPPNTQPRAASHLRGPDNDEERPNHKREEDQYGQHYLQLALSGTPVHVKALHCAVFHGRGPSLGFPDLTRRL